MRYGRYWCDGVYVFLLFCACILLWLVNKGPGLLPRETSVGHLLPVDFFGSGMPPFPALFFYLVIFSIRT
ncbi:hypothetical protein F5Y17DRAFT_426114 [Xylariaceae sp. FL0594]|nr:hypothetical protein F5Y17DRAFT_426114 [Xylariaceae sp. FL0594]